MTNEPGIDTLFKPRWQARCPSYSQWSLRSIVLLLMWAVSSPCWSGVEVIYIPREFPRVCAWSMSEDRPLCPADVTEHPSPFCQRGLTGLDLARNALGFPDCNGQTAADSFVVPIQESVVQWVLLIDDVGASGELLDLLRPVVADGVVQPRLQLFRNQAGTVIMEALIVGETQYEFGGPGNGPVAETEWRSRVTSLLRSDSRLDVVQNLDPALDTGNSRRGQEQTVGDAGPSYNDGASRIPSCYRFEGDVPLVVDSGDSFSAALFLTCEDRAGDLQFDDATEILLANYQQYPAWEAYIISSLIRRGYDPEHIRRFMRESDGFRRVHAEFGNDEDIDPCRTSLWLEIPISYRRDGSLRPVTGEFRRCESDAVETDSNAAAAATESPRASAGGTPQPNPNRREEP
jgi:hypothetical protein